MNVSSHNAMIYMIIQAVIQPDTDELTYWQTHTHLTLTADVDDLLFGMVNVLSKWFEKLL